MAIYKTKSFRRWAVSTGLNEPALELAKAIKAGALIELEHED